MDLVSTIRKSGSRGGVNFSWDEVANSAHRENYLGHSLKAPVGRWQAGRDLQWYAKADADNLDPNETEDERKARLRREEIQKIKEAEEDEMAKALGLPPPVRNQSGANAIEVSGSRVLEDHAAPGGLQPRATESIAIGTGIAAIVAVKTTGGEDIGTRKVLFIHVTKTEGIGTGAEVVIQNVTGDKDGTMPCAARVVARVTDGGAGPETETATDTAAGPQSTG